MADSAAVSSPKDIGAELGAFVHNIDALQSSFPLMTILTTGIAVACEKNRNDFLTKNCQVAAETDPPTFTIPPNQRLQYDRVHAQMKSSAAGLTILPQSFVVALISQYDAFLGGLLRCVYRARPELLKQSKRRLTFSQLHEFGDMEKAKEFILE